MSGGIGEILGSAVPAALLLGGPVAGAVVAGAAAIASLVSSFLPDPRQTRANQISKTMFTQQYLAPPPINMMASTSGGYSDVDIYGNVRESNFSPYPITSSAYLDVPRRTVVPGHGISTFGGFSNTPGALTPNPVIYNVTIQAMDSKSFIDHANDITTAVHHEIQSNFHPLVRDLGLQLGTR